MIVYCADYTFFIVQLVVFLLCKMCGICCATYGKSYL